MLYCDACEMQAFSRGEKSAGLLATGVRPVGDDEPAPAPVPPKPNPQPAPKRGILDGL